MRKWYPLHLLPTCSLLYMILLLFWKLHMLVCLLPSIFYRQTKLNLRRLRESLKIRQLGNAIKVQTSFGNGSVSCRTSCVQKSIDTRFQYCRRQKNKWNKDPSCKPWLETKFLSFYFLFCEIDKIVIIVQDLLPSSYSITKYSWKFKKWCKVLFPLGTRNRVTETKQGYFLFSKEKNARSGAGGM